VAGTTEEIPALVERYGITRIIIAIPSAKKSTVKRIHDICLTTRCKVEILPGIYQFVNGQVSVAALREIDVQDLLGRESTPTDLDAIMGYIQGRTVLVTGGGGSIGSELCRQIATHGPRRLIILDIYENNAYDIQLELKSNFPGLKLTTLIGSVRDSRRIFQVFDTYRPQIVYHAAAHKHVPLMEDSPCEAVKNNAIGTYKTAYAAMVHGCERFVLISTDKAVNPTNVMGASKRLCEMIIQCFDAKIKEGKACEIPQLFTHLGEENADKDGTGRVFENIQTEFVAVRFGNVLGSNGSVIPLFKRQIAKGGPVTVTHPDIIRYFMTIPEAVSLVMLAGTYAHGGEIFVLDMGRPVKIDSLARNLIKLAGFKPGEDIKIVYTGLRPGEKLYEEKLMSEEGLRKTDNDLIHIGNPIPFDHDLFLVKLSGLMDVAYANKGSLIREKLMDMVSTYHPADAGAPIQSEGPAETEKVAS
ncbi:MAG: polysaccharide biosynthesis protein, partial [Clostridia bacterium]|nr:polysaccharide biosynthesis protein [Clostridia bacterium]